MKTKRITESILDTILYLSGLFNLILNAFKNLPSLRIGPVRTVFFRQIYFAGIETLGKMAIIGLLIGIVIISQITSLIGVGRGELIGKILVWVVIRELGPLFAAIVVIARSVTAISAELGSMNVQGEIASIEMMGIDPERYLIMPRIIALTLSAVMLTFYFELAAILGGITVTSVFWGIPFEQHTTGILTSLTIAELSASLVKSLLFGLAISAVSCSQGLKVTGSITKIPQATTKATMQSLFFVFIFDGIITLIFFL